MDIFKRKSKLENLPSLFAPGEIEQISNIDYEQVLEYLVGLSDKDFKTITEVAVVYRCADVQCAEIMGKPVEPTTFIDPPTNTETVPAHVNHIEPKSFLDDDDELESAFLETPVSPGPKKRAARKATK